MVKRRRVSKKIFNGKREDLIPVTSPFLALVQRHLLYIIVGSIFVFLSITGFFLWKYVDKKKEDKASILFYQAYNVYQESIKEEKTLEQSLQLFQSLAQNYSGTSAGIMSLFYAGNCQFALKKFDEAITSYNKFLEDVPSQTKMDLLAYDSLGYCYEEKKDFKKAIEYFQKTITPPPGLGESGCLNICRCFESLNDKENSLKFYKKFLFEYPNSQRIDFVREKVRGLESNPGT